MAKNTVATEAKRVTLSEEAWKQIEELKKITGINSHGALIELAVREMFRRKTVEEKGA